MKLLSLAICLFTTYTFAAEINLPLAHPATGRDLQEYLTVIRTVGQIRTVGVENGSTIHVEGTPEEIAFAQWVVKQVDRPAGWQPSAQDLENPATRTFENKARLFYLPENISVQSTQETLTIIRTVLDAQKIFNTTSRHALIAAGTPAELEAMEWLLKALVTPTSEPYRIADPRFDTLRVFALAPTTTAQQTQEVLTHLRRDLRIQKVFNLNTPPTIVVRASAADIDRTARELK